MKIAAGGVGTVASAMACNAKSVFPYIWAWNAIGATTGSGPGQHTVRVSQNATLSSDPEGVKHESDGNDSYVAFRDESTDATDKTGKLDASVIDFTKARYMHGVFNMSGWTTGAGTNSGKSFVDISPGSGAGQLYYYTALSGANPWKGVNSIKHIHLGQERWLIVWDMHTQLVGGNGATWQSMTTTMPVHLEPWWGGANSGNSFFPDGQSMVWCGMVLSDRILTDIPLPIRTHMG